jgi:hypothetical protein
LKIESSEVGEAEYERFLDAFAVAPGPALPYHYPFYVRFLTEMAYPGSTPRFMIARDDAGALAGVMPAIHVNTADVHAWLSLAYFGPNGGAIVPNGDTAGGAAIVRELVAGACADARDRGCESMTVYTPLDASPAPYRDAFGGADFEIARIAQVLALPDPDAAGAQSPWPRKVRYDIRRAASLGVVARPVAGEAELDRLWDIYRANCQDAGTPVKPREHIRRLFQTARSRGIFLVAEHAGAIVAGLICFMGGGVLSYYLPCTRAESRPQQPGLLLLDHAVAIAREAGCRMLNFEASPDVGDSVYQFKARSGGEPVPYRVFVKLLAPGVLERYRALGATRIAAQVPNAFIVPFGALSSDGPPPTTTS